MEIMDLTEFTKKSQDKCIGLTERETEIAYKLYYPGFSRLVIAGLLNYSPKAIEADITIIYQKFASKEICEEKGGGRMDAILREFLKWEIELDEEDRTIDAEKIKKMSDEELWGFAGEGKYREFP